MKNLIKNNLFKIITLVACISASKITWLGTYEAKIPNSLKKS